MSSESGHISLRRKAGSRFLSITPEQFPVGSFVMLYSHVANGEEVVDTVLFLGTVMPAYTPTPTPIPPPTATPTPTRTPLPPLRPVLQSVAGYSPLPAEAASNLRANYDFGSEGLSAGERDILDWADSRLFSDPSFLASKWGPENWPYAHLQELQRRYESAMKRVNQNIPSDTLPDSGIKLVSAQALLLMMLEIDIQKKTNGKHVVKWEVDSLDRVLDDFGIYTGQCIHSYGKSGYDTVEGLRDNYVPIIWGHRHVHREMLRSFAYLANADGEGILAKSLLENDPDDFELIYKRRADTYPSTITVGSFAYEIVSFISQILLPEGRLVSLPTMALGAVGDAGTEREAVEAIFDYTRKKLKHYTGGLEDFVDIFSPYTVTPYSPEPEWILYTGEAGSPSSSAVVTGLARAVGLKAKQFRTPKHVHRAGSVEADGFSHHYDGNSLLGSHSDTVDICVFFDKTLEEIDSRNGDLLSCTK